jgi:hypothetical protein
MFHLAFAMQALCAIGGNSGNARPQYYSPSVRLPGTGLYLFKHAGHGPSIDRLHIDQLQ